VDAKQVTRPYNSTVKRWFLCECARASCREQFFMRVREYEQGYLGDVRFVVPEHKPTGAKVLARWDGVVMIERS